MTDKDTDTGAYSSAMSENGDSAFPTQRSKEDNDTAREELDDACDHTAPSKDDKRCDDSDHVKTDGASRGAADEQATVADRSI